VFGLSAWLCSRTMGLTTHQTNRRVGLVFGCTYKWWLSQLTRPIGVCAQRLAKPKHMWVWRLGLALG